MIPFQKISADLKEPLRRGQLWQALQAYCFHAKCNLTEMNYSDFVEWAKEGLTKLRAGCSGKKRYVSRKEAKQKLKTHIRFPNDGVYECSHCQGWHVTSNLTEPQGEVFRYFLYGVELI